MGGRVLNSVLDDNAGRWGNPKTITVSSRILVDYRSGPGCDTCDVRPVAPGVRPSVAGVVYDSYDSASQVRMDIGEIHAEVHTSIADCDDSSGPRPTPAVDLRKGGRGVRPSHDLRRNLVQEDDPRFDITRLVPHVR